MYGVGRLQHKKHVLLMNFNHMTILLKRGVLVALKIMDCPLFLRIRLDTKY